MTLSSIIPRYESLRQCGIAAALGLAVLVALSPAAQAQDYT